MSVSIRRHLEQLLAQLERRVAEFDRPANERAPDTVDLAVENEDREVGSALRSRNVEDAAQIRAALQRMDDGTYGACATCGKEIAPARLRALPMAAQCLTCAAAGERVKRDEQLGYRRPEASRLLEGDL